MFVLRFSNLIHFETLFVLTIKRLEGGEGGEFGPPHLYGFSRERMKPYCLVTINVIISYIFPENFIEIHRVVQKILKSFFFSFSYFLDFLIILIFVLVLTYFQQAAERVQKAILILDELFRKYKGTTGSQTDPSREKYLQKPQPHQRPSLF